MNQLTLDLARDRGTAAGQACVDKADRTAPGWSERAYDAIRRFAAGQAGAFTIEELREGIDIDKPHDLRAFGPVTQKALRKGLIEMVPGEMARAASSHGSFKPMYRRGVGALANA